MSGESDQHEEELLRLLERGGLQATANPRTIPVDSLSLTLNRLSSSTSRSWSRRGHGRRLTECAGLPRVFDRSRICFGGGKILGTLEGRIAGGSEDTDIRPDIPEMLVKIVKGLWSQLRDLATGPDA